jgi:hypothetical protein
MAKFIVKNSKVLLLPHTAVHEEKDIKCEKKFPG